MKFFGERLGMYELDKSFISNGKPTYKHHSKNIYLHWNHASHWTVNIFIKTKIYLTTNDYITSFTTYFDLIDCMLLLLSCLLKRILSNIGDSSTTPKVKMVLVHKILPKTDGWFIYNTYQKKSSTSIRLRKMGGLKIVHLYYA